MARCRPVQWMGVLLRAAAQDNEPAPAAWDTLLPLRV